MDNAERVRVYVHTLRNVGAERKGHLEPDALADALDAILAGARRWQMTVEQQSLILFGRRWPTAEDRAELERYLDEIYRDYSATPTAAQPVAAQPVGGVVSPDAVDRVINEELAVLKTDAQLFRYIAAHHPGLVAEAQALLHKFGDGAQPIAGPDANERPPYPDGNVIGPCVCGSWPGGPCLKCTWVPRANSSAGE